MNEPTGEPLMDMTAAARFLGVKRTTLQNWVWQRRVPFVKLGPGKNALVRFRPEALREWIRAREVPPENPGDLTT